MKTGISLILCAFLVACGGGAENNHGYGWGYDAETANVGLRIQYSDGVDPTSHYADPSALEAFYIETEACAEMEAEAPLVVIIPDYYVHGTYAGYTYYDTGLIVISDYALLNSSFTGKMIKHEFMHYILLRNGKNPDHDNPLFAACGL